MKELLSGPLWSNPCPRPADTSSSNPFHFFPDHRSDKHGIGRLERLDINQMRPESTRLYMSVSENRGTPKSSILIGFSIINHPFWGTPIFGNTHMIYYHTWLKTRRLKVHPMKIISVGLGCSQIPFPTDCPGHTYIYIYAYLYTYRERTL